MVDVQNIASPVHYFLEGLQVALQYNACQPVIRLEAPLPGK